MNVHPLDIIISHLPTFTTKNVFATKFKIKAFFVFPSYLTEVHNNLFISFLIDTFITSC
jgi:hypothetical protein